MNRKFFECACGDCSHNLAISLDTDDDLEYTYVHVHLCQSNNFFKRLWLALKYVLNCESEMWGHYTEIILNKQTTKDLTNFLNNDK